MRVLTSPALGPWTPKRKAGQSGLALGSPGDGGALGRPGGVHPGPPAQHGLHPESPAEESSLRSWRQLPFPGKSSSQRCARRTWFQPEVPTHIQGHSRVSQGGVKLSSLPLPPPPPAHPERPRSAGERVPSAAGMCPCWHPGAPGGGGFQGPARAPPDGSSPGLPLSSQAPALSLR